MNWLETFRSTPAAGLEVLNASAWTKYFLADVETINHTGPRAGGSSEDPYYVGSLTHTQFRLRD
jgi:hypothetical protein